VLALSSVAKNARATQEVESVVFKFFLEKTKELRARSIRVASWLWDAALCFVPGQESGERRPESCFRLQL
jgi:hypothetical protein